VRHRASIPQPGVSGSPTSTRPRGARLPRSPAPAVHETNASSPFERPRSSQSRSAGRLPTSGERARRSPGALRRRTESIRHLSIPSAPSPPIAASHDCDGLRGAHPPLDACALVIRFVRRTASCVRPEGDIVSRTASTANAGKRGKRGQTREGRQTRPRRSLCDTHLGLRALTARSASHRTPTTRPQASSVPPLPPLLPGLCLACTWLARTSPLPTSRPSDRASHRHHGSWPNMRLDCKVQPSRAITRERPRLRGVSNTVRPSKPLDALWSHLSGSRWSFATDRKPEPNSKGESATRSPAQGACFALMRSDNVRPCDFANAATRGTRKRDETLLEGRLLAR
jgi:hypothetical protein